MYGSKEPRARRHAAYRALRRRIDYFLLLSNDIFVIIVTLSALREEIGTQVELEKKMKKR